VESSRVAGNLLAIPDPRGRKGRRHPLATMLAAMFCQRDLCRQIVDSGGDYLLVVKGNHPELKAAIEAEFTPGFSPR